MCIVCKCFKLYLVLLKIQNQKKYIYIYEVYLFYGGCFTVLLAMLFMLYFKIIFITGLYMMYVLDSYLYGGEELSLGCSLPAGGIL